MTIEYKTRPERIKVVTARTSRAKRPRIDYADRLVKMIEAEHLTGWFREYRFAAHASGGLGKGTRARLAAAGWKDWRFDAAHPGLKVAIEIDGGNYLTGINPRNGQAVAVGRHTQADDYRKLNAANCLGWHVLRYTPEMLARGEWLRDLESIFDKLIRPNGIGKE